MNRYEEGRLAGLREAAERLHAKSWLAVDTARHYRLSWLSRRGGTNTSNRLQEAEAEQVAKWEAFNEAEEILRVMVEEADPQNQEAT